MSKQAGSDGCSRASFGMQASLQQDNHRLCVAYDLFGEIVDEVLKITKVLLGRGIPNKMNFYE